MVVPFMNLSAFDGTPPQAGESRKIGSGPLYPLVEIQCLAAREGSVALWTAKCRRDVANLTLDTADVGAMIGCLKPLDYRGSEWCDNGKDAWAACDAYVLREMEYVERAGRSFPMEYFLKFALSKTGVLVLVVSCHT